jgi:hypothetical protein
MTEMHKPVRALYVIDAPIQRVETVLNRRKELKDLVYNDWVKVVIRDPDTKQFFKMDNGVFKSIDIEEINNMDLSYVPFTEHRKYGLDIAKNEENIYHGSMAGLVFSFLLPSLIFSPMNPYGPLLALFGTSLALPILSFARRYLHGEYIFGRFAILNVALVLGFNIVCTAPNLVVLVSGIYF